MATIKGITVTLYERTQAGKDPFGSPTYEENPVAVENVIVAPAAADDIVSGVQLYGKHAVYELCIPKGDTHKWEDSRVDFMGHSFRVFGPVQEWIESMVPGDWNKKVKVERFG